MKEVTIALFRGAKKEMQWVVVNHLTGEHKIESCAHAACITARRWFNDIEKGFVPDAFERAGFRRVG